MPDLLDQTVLGFSSVDPFTIRDACEGVQIFGSSGSGKTSGSAQLFAKSYLRAGFGGLVLTAKADEADLWRRYAAETGRSHDLIVISPSEPHRFNILQYECSQAAAGGGDTRNILGLFLTLAEVVGRRRTSSSSENDAHWRRELEKLLLNAIDLLRFADEPITFQSICKIVQSAPTSVEDIADETFNKKSFCQQACVKAQLRFEGNQLSSMDGSDWSVTADYWGHEFPNKHPRPRSSVIDSFTGMIAPFIRGIIRELFSTTTTVRPDDCSDGKIIVVDLPKATSNEIGVYAQVLVKYCWQRAVERRRIESTSRPVFLWADESQNFVNEYDTRFQTAARGYRVSTVYITQSLPNYHYYMGDDGSHALTKALLGNLSTKIFHNNTCVETNTYAAELFARDWKEKTSSNGNFGNGKWSFGQNSQRDLNYSVEPREFSGLMKGGPLNDFLVEGIVHQGGKIFNASGTNALRVIFNQRMP